MIPKDKASELVNNMIPYAGDGNLASKMQNAKMAALVAVNEILGHMGADRGYFFWTEVRQEIEML